MLIMTGHNIHIHKYQVSSLIDWLLLIKLLEGIVLDTEALNIIVKMV